jgi:hypothetical protein
VSAQTALNIVDELSQVGLVNVERVGGLVLVVLNRGHIFAEPLYALVRARGQLIKRLSEELARWDELAAAWLFGSAARGDGDRSSDIDLLLVAEAGIDDAEWGSNVATNAIHAAIAAADAICCVALRERSADGNHGAAIQLLGEVDRTLAATLRRALHRKNQVAYEARDIADADAQAYVRQATALIESARERVASI